MIAREADVIVVGAGPAGSTTATYLAQSGLDVALLEKSAFPREKVCGDGFTPRAVVALNKLGIDTSTDAGWLQNKGLRIIAAGMRLEIPWPELTDYPGYGLVRTRLNFDEMLANRAQKAGAHLLERTTVTAPIIDERTDRIVGVRARPVNDDGSKGDEVEYRAPLVVAADGNSSRLSLAMGLRKRDDRPLGVAVRTYFTSPRHDDDWLESWLELWDERPDGSRMLLPGYGWVFGMGDGTSNVGLGVLDSSGAFGQVDYKALMRTWLASMPAEWQFTPEYQVGDIRGAALPMGFNRQPHYTRGLLLVGDAGGMVNPFNGEGIAYAMEAGEIAATVVSHAYARTAESERERVLVSYPEVLKATYGGYYTLGRYFVRLIGQPQVMRIATRHGLPHPTLMRFVLKLMANLTEPRGGDAMDRIINGLARIAPAA